MTTLIIALILTIAYNAVAIIKNKGIPPSLSDSFYVFGGRDGWGYVFYVYLASIVFLLMPLMLDITPENWQFIAFIGVASLGFVGAAADFKSHDRKTHVVSALLSAVFSLLWCLVVGVWQVALLSTGAAIVFAYTNPSSKVYWLEMGCFASVFITLFLILLT